MSATNDEVAAPVRTLCLGDALVELICKRPIDDLAQADGRRGAPVGGCGVGTGMREVGGD